MDKIDRLKELIERAESLIGKKVRNGTIGSYLRVSDFFVILTKKQANERSSSVMEEFLKTGFCVALRDEIGGTSVPLLNDTNIFREDVTLKLTSDYDAIVSRDNVKVGCQTIPRAKIVELYNLMMEFK